MGGGFELQVTSNSPYRPMDAVRKVKLNKVLSIRSPHLRGGVTSKKPIYISAKVHSKTQHYQQHSTPNSELICNWPTYWGKSFCPVVFVPRQKWIVCYAVHVKGGLPTPFTKRNSTCRFFHSENSLISKIIILSHGFCFVLRNFFGHLVDHLLVSTIWKHWIHCKEQKQS